MRSLPYVASGVTINRIEVWVTNKRGNYDDARNIVALSDLGEHSAQHVLNPAWSVDAGARTPHNKANNLYETLVGSYKIATNWSSYTGEILPLSEYKEES
jgi:cell surface protein SprA